MRLFILVVVCAILFAILFEIRNNKINDATSCRNSGMEWVQVDTYTFRCLPRN